MGGNFNIGLRLVWSKRAKRQTQGYKLIPRIKPGYNQRLSGIGVCDPVMGYFAIFIYNLGMRLNLDIQVGCTYKGYPVICSCSVCDLAPLKPPVENKVDIWAIDSSSTLIPIADSKSKIFPYHWINRQNSIRTDLFWLDSDLCTNLLVGIPFNQCFFYRTVFNQLINSCCIILFSLSFIRCISLFSNSILNCYGFTFCLHLSPIWSYILYSSICRLNKSCSRISIKKNSIFEGLKDQLIRCIFFHRIIQGRNK